MEGFVNFLTLSNKLSNLFIYHDKIVDRACWQIYNFLQCIVVVSFFLYTCDNIISRSFWFLLSTDLLISLLRWVWSIKLWLLWQIGCAKIKRLTNCDVRVVFFWDSRLVNKCPNNALRLIDSLLLVLAFYECLLSLLFCIEHFWLNNLLQFLLEFCRLFSRRRRRLHQRQLLLVFLPLLETCLSNELLTCWHMMITLCWCTWTIRWKWVQWWLGWGQCVTRFKRRLLPCCRCNIRVFALLKKCRLDFIRICLFFWVKHLLLIILVFLLYFLHLINLPGSNLLFSSQVTSLLIVSFQKLNHSRIFCDLNWSLLWGILRQNEQWFLQKQHRRQLYIAIYGGQMQSGTALGGVFDVGAPIFEQLLNYFGPTRLHCNFKRCPIAFAFNVWIHLSIITKKLEEEKVG